MESITIYPKNEKQKSLLQSLLQEMKVRFEIGTKDSATFTEEAFYAKIDQAAQKALLGL